MDGSGSRLFPFHTGLEGFVVQVGSKRGAALIEAMPPRIATLSDEDAALRCEHLIRNYDPCISCSVHFLKLKRHGAAAPPREHPGSP